MFQFTAILEATLGVQSTVEQPCTQPYQELFPTPKLCAGYAVKPKFGSAFARHSTNSKETADFVGSIKPDGVICYSCCKFHLIQLPENR